MIVQRQSCIGRFPWALQAQSRLGSSDVMLPILLRQCPLSSQKLSTFQYNQLGWLYTGKDAPVILPRMQTETQDDIGSVIRRLPRSYQIELVALRFILLVHGHQGPCWSTVVCLSYNGFTDSTTHGYQVGVIGSVQVCLGLCNTLGLGQRPHTSGWVFLKNVTHSRLTTSPLMDFRDATLRSCIVRRPRSRLLVGLQY